MGRTIKGGFASEHCTTRSIPWVRESNRTFREYILVSIRRFSGDFLCTFQICPLRHFFCCNVMLFVNISLQNLAQSNRLLLTFYNLCCVDFTVMHIASILKRELKVVADINDIIADCCSAYCSHFCYRECTNHKTAICNNLFCGSHFHFTSINSIIAICEDKYSSAALCGTILCCIHYTPFCTITQLCQASKNDAEVTTSLLRRRFEQTVNILQNTKRSLLSNKDISDLPPQNTLLALDAFGRCQSMCYGIVLTRKSTHQECVVGHHCLVHYTNVLTRVVLTPQVCTIAKMLNIAVVRPLCFCPWLPLGKPCSFPS